MFLLCYYESVNCTVSLPRMKEHGISKSDGTVVFGQLLGMCNHVSFTLGKVAM